MESAEQQGGRNGIAKRKKGKAVALLSNLRDTSKARAFCRDYIQHLIREGMASSLTSIGTGMLNEYLVLRDSFAEHTGFRFTGISFSQKIIDDARKDYPAEQWSCCDIVRQGADSRLQGDIVYSQHLLEQCPGLDPAFSNLLSLTRKVFIHIFSLPPRKDELIQWPQYPLYQNHYSARHIRKVLSAHGFDAKMLTFANKDLPGFGEGCPPREVVLIALKNEDSESRPEFEYDALPELNRLSSFAE